MADSGTWYLKMDDGTVYGPADLKRLQAWAREGRIGSSSQISSDRKSWTPASLLPELGMEWIIEVGQGEYFGPFHPDVIRDLIAQKRVPASARRFRLDTGRAQEDHSKELNAALAKARAAVTERESALAKETALVAERESALAKAKALVAERESALVKAKALVSEKEASIVELKAALAEQKTLVAGLRNQEAGLSAKLENSLKESRSVTAASVSRIEDLEASLKAERARADELETALKKALASEREQTKAFAASQSEVAASQAHAKELEVSLKAEHARAGELETALKAEHVRVENLLAQLVSAAEREKALRADLDLAHKTAASERKCVEAAIRRERQAAKELEDARKDAEDLRVKMQKAREQPKAMKGKGGLFQGASAAELAFLEQAARRELASARGRAAPVPRPQPKTPDVIDV